MSIVKRVQVSEINLFSPNNIENVAAMGHFRPYMAHLRRYMAKPLRIGPVTQKIPDGTAQTHLPPNE